MGGRGREKPPRLARCWRFGPLTSPPQGVATQRADGVVAESGEIESLSNAIRPRWARELFAFFSRSLSVRIKKKLEIAFLLSPELSLLSLLKKKSTFFLLQVSWDWSCESTVIYRAVSYLDTYMASVGVQELGKYQVRRSEEEKELVEGCFESSREKENVRFFSSRFCSLSSLGSTAFPRRMAPFSARERAPIGLPCSANAGR